MRSLALPLCVSLLALPARGAPEPASEPLVAQAIAAFGGRERIEGLSTLLAGSRFRRVVGGEHDEGILAEFYAFPERARREYKGRHVEVAGTDGVAAWAVRSQAVVPDDGGRFTVPLRLWQLGRLLIDVVDGRARAEPVPGAAAGRARLLLTLAGGEMIQLDVDESTGRVRRYAGEAHDGAATDLLVIDIVKWREQDGHLLPAHFVVRVNDELREEVILTEARVNGPMSSRFFEAPWGVVGPAPRKL